VSPRQSSDVPCRCVTLHVGHWFLDRIMSDISAGNNNDNILWARWCGSICAYICNLFLLSGSSVFRFLYAWINTSCTQFNRTRLFVKFPLSLPPFTELEVYDVLFCIRKSKCYLKIEEQRWPEVQRLKKKKNWKAHVYAMKFNCMNCLKRAYKIII
jgi:hypothetical protein